MTYCYYNPKVSNHQIIRHNHCLFFPSPFQRSPRIATLAIYRAPWRGQFHGRFRFLAAKFYGQELIKVYLCSIKPAELVKEKRKKNIGANYFGQTITVGRVWWLHLFDPFIFCLTSIHQWLVTDFVGWGFCRMVQARSEKDAWWCLQDMPSELPILTTDQ